MARQIILTKKPIHKTNINIKYKKLAPPTDTDGKKYKNSLENVFYILLPIYGKVFTKKR